MAEALLYLATSVASIVAYGVDKSAARYGRWRTPESTLHLLAVIGGWPGALIAQKIFHHKSRKPSFQVAFLCTVAWPRLGRRTALTFPLLPPPQKNWSPPSDSSPDTLTPGGISSLSRTSPVRGSTRLKSLSSPSDVPCHSSPSIHVTPVTNRLDSIVRRIDPVSGST